MNANPRNFLIVLRTSFYLLCVIRQLLRELVERKKAEIKGIHRTHRMHCVLKCGEVPYLEHDASKTSRARDFVVILSVGV